MNRRNAVVGWLTLNVGKRVVKRKVKDTVPRVKDAVVKEAVPKIDPKTGKPNRGAIALLLAGTAGVVSLVRSRLGGGGAAKG